MTPFGMTGIYAHGDEQSYDGVPLAPGVHLRWSFDPILGFPRGGFQLERWRLKVLDAEFGLSFEASGWTTLADRLGPTTNATELAQRIAGGSAFRHLRHGFGLPAMEISTAGARLAAMGTAAHTERLGDEAGGVSLSAFNMMSLAALDPTMARVLGLAFHDPEIGPTEPVAYRLSATWVGPELPQVHHWLPGSSTVTGTSKARIGEVEAACSGLFAWSSDTTGPRVTATGARLTLALPMACRRVWIALASGAPPSGLVASARASGETLGREVTVATITGTGSEPSFVTLQAADGKAFDEVMIGGPALERSGATLPFAQSLSLSFRAIHLFEFLEAAFPPPMPRPVVVRLPAGLTLADLRKGQGGANPAGLQLDSFALARRMDESPAPLPLAVAGVRQMSALRGLDEHGGVPVGRAHARVEPVLATSSPPDNAMGLAVEATRFQVWRASGASTAVTHTSAAEGGLCTARGPWPGLRPTLVADWDAAKAAQASGVIQIVDQVGRLPLRASADRNPVLSPIFASGGASACEFTGNSPLTVTPIASSPVHKLGDGFYAEAWLSVEGAEVAARTILHFAGASAASTVWFGLRRAPGPHLCLTIGARSVLAPVPLPDSRVPIHVGVLWDGRSVAFVMNGAVHPTDDLLPPPPDDTFDRIAVGGRLGGGATDPTGWVGKLCRLRLWALRPVELGPGVPGLLYDMGRDGRGLSRRGPVATSTSEPGRFRLNGEGWLHLDPQNAETACALPLRDRHIGQTLTVEAWVAPAGLETASRPMTIVQASTAFGLSLGAGAIAPRGALVLLIRGRVYVSKRVRVTGPGLHHIAAGKHPDGVVFYVDGVEESQAASELDAGLAALLPLPIGDPGGGGILIGTNTTDLGAAARTPFQGVLSMLRLWSTVPGPPSLPLRGIEAREVEHERIVGEEGAAPPVTDVIMGWTDRWVEDGTWSWAVAGVDIFGRQGPFSAARSLVVETPASLDPPAGVELRPAVIEGRVKSCSTIEAGLQVSTDIEAGETLKGALTSAEGAWKRLVSQPALLRRIVSSGAGSRCTHQQRYRIHDARAAGGVVQVDLDEALPTNLNPQVEDRIVLEGEYAFDLRWTWTGHQQLFCPSAQGFQIHLFPGEPGLLLGKISSPEEVNPGEYRLVITVPRRVFGARVPSTLQGAKTLLVGEQAYRITSIPGVPTATGARLAIPLVVRDLRPRPAMPPDGAEGRVRVEPAAAGIDLAQRASWPGRIDQEALGTLLEGLQPVTAATAAVSALDSAGLDALIAALGESAELAPQWLKRWLEDLKIGRDLWMPWRVRLPQLNDAALKAPDVPGLLVGAVYADRQLGWRSWETFWSHNVGGAGYVYVRPDRLPPDGQTASMDTAARGDPPWRPGSLYGVRYFPGRRFETRVYLPDLAASLPPGQARLGLSVVGDSGVEASVIMAPPVVQVDRRMPEAPPAPTVSVAPPDVYGRCVATLGLGAGEAVVGINYEVWRASESSLADIDTTLRRAAYKAGEATVDVAIDEWAADLAGEDDDTEQEPVWMAWIRRHYPALTNVELRQLAAQSGMEAAFAQVTTTPVATAADGTWRCEDTLPTTRERVIYRLVAVAEGGARSSFGGQSLPARIPTGAPPRPPALTGLTPGDRSLALGWTLLPDPDVDRYRIYRADNADAIEDPRWVGEDGLTLVEIADPRIRAERAGTEEAPTFRLRVPEGVVAADVRHVFARSPSYTGLAGAPNARVPDLRDRESTAEEGYLALHRVPEGTPLVLAVGPEDGPYTAVEAWPGEVPWTDAGIQGLKDYWYRVAAVNRFGQEGRLSKVVRGRGLEWMLGSPNLTVALRESLNDLQHRITLNLELNGIGFCNVMRLNESTRQWIRIAGPHTASAVISHDVAADEAATYRAVWHSSASGASAISEDCTSSPPLTTGDS